MESAPDLAASLRMGQEAAWERLVRDSTARLLAVARRILRNEFDAEEAVQEAFLAAYRNLGQFDGRAALTTWLHRITVNAALSRLRRRERAASMHEHPLGRAAEAAYEPAEQADLARVVWAAVAELAEDQRVVLVLRDVEQLSSREVAEALGLSDAAVRQRLHRARQAVAERLQPELGVGSFITCGGRVELLFDAIDGELADDVRDPVLAHLSACRTCATLRAGYESTLAALRSQGVPSGTEEAARAIELALEALRRERAKG